MSEITELTFTLDCDYGRLSRRNNSTNGFNYGKEKSYSIQDLLNECESLFEEFEYLEKEYSKLEEQIENLESDVEFVTKENKDLKDEIEELKGCISNG